MFECFMHDSNAQKAVDFGFAVIQCSYLRKLTKLILASQLTIYSRINARDLKRQIPIVSVNFRDTYSAFISL